MPWFVVGILQEGETWLLSSPGKEFYQQLFTEGFLVELFKDKSYKLVFFFLTKVIHVIFIRKIFFLKISFCFTSLCGCFACMYVFVLCLCLVPIEAERGH